MNMASESYEIPSLDEQLSFNSVQLFDNDENYVREYLQIRGVTAKSLKDDIQHLEEWYKKQSHLPEDPLLKRRFFQYLFISGLSVEKTKLKVDNYYTLRKKYPEIMQQRDPLASELEREIKYPYLIFLPKRTNDHHRVCLCRLKGPRIFDMNLVKFGFMVADIRLLNEAHMGEHWDAYAIKVKGIHVTNIPTFGEPLLNLFKKVTKQKIVDRIQIYNNFEDIFEVLPKSIFPRDFGGDELSCEEINEIWAQTMQSPAWREWFLTQDDVCTDESKRLVPSEIDDPGMFGVDGSFKELCID